MKSEFSVVVATYGDLDVWGPFSMKALDSIAAQTFEPASISRVHGTGLADARNRGAEQATGEWLIFLDADDELDAGYIAAMSAAAAGAGQQRALLKPSTLGIYPDGTTDDHPVLIEARPLLDSNHLVIGTAMRRAEFVSAGGFVDMPALEDWHLFIRMQLAGAAVVEVPDAVYRVGVWPNSRNHNTQLHGQAYTRIRQEFAWAKR